MGLVLLTLRINIAELLWRVRAICVSKNCSLVLASRTLQQLCLAGTLLHWAGVLGAKAESLTHLWYGTIPAYCLRYRMSCQAWAEPTEVKETLPIDFRGFEWQLDLWAALLCMNHMPDFTFIDWLIYYGKIKLCKSKGRHNKLMYLRQ